MPCKDTTSQISIILDYNDNLLDFEYTKATCNKEIGGNTGFREFCIGKSIEVLSILEFNDLVEKLGLQEQETQFLFYLEWSALIAALDQYQGLLPAKNYDRYQIANISYESNQVEIKQMVLAPSNMPKIIPCRKK